MHPTAEQLLASSSAATCLDVSSHLEHCAHCRSDLDAYRETAQGLRALPQLEPDSMAWSYVQGRLKTGGEPAIRRRAALFIAAGIATLAVVLTFVAVREDPFSSEASMQVAITGNDDLVALMQHSRELDLMLQELPNRPRVERVAMAATLDSMENRIQWLDAQLTHGVAHENDDQNIRTLWRERVELMDSLVKVRYAQAGSVSF